MRVQSETQGEEEFQVRGYDRTAGMDFDDAGRVRRMQPPAAVVDGGAFGVNAHTGPEVRKRVSSPRADYREQAGGIEGKEPDAAAAGAVAGIGPDVRFGEMRDVRNRRDMGNG